MNARIFWPGACLLLIVPGGCDRNPPPRQTVEPPAVGVIEASTQKVNPYFEFVGKTRAVESVEIRARVTGELESRDFQEGSDVERGQLLFRIERGRYEAALAQANAELAAAEAELNRARVDLARMEELVKANNVAVQKVDEAKADVLIREAAVQTARASVSVAQLDVDYTEIVAPVAGRIDLARYDVGNVLGPESGVLATINRMDPMTVIFSISETWYLALLEARKEAEAAGKTTRDATHVPRIRLANGNIYEHAGEFDFIDNKVDEQTGTVLIRVVFPNSGLLLPGQFVNVIIAREEARDSIVVPQAAVLTDQGGHYVLLVNDEEKVEVRRIVTGQRFGTGWAVEEGLTQGERVVLYGVQKVRPGLEVKAELTKETPSPVEGKVGDGPPESEAPESQS